MFCAKRLSTTLVSKSSGKHVTRNFLNKWNHQIVRFYKQQQQQQERFIDIVQEQVVAKRAIPFFNSIYSGAVAEDKQQAIAMLLNVCNQKEQYAMVLELFDTLLYKTQQEKKNDRDSNIIMPTIGMYVSILNSCAQLNDVLFAERVWQHFEQHQAELNSDEENNSIADIFASMVMVYQRAGKAEQALKLATQVLQEHQDLILTCRAFTTLLSVFEKLALANTSSWAVNMDLYNQYAELVWALFDRARRDKQCKWDRASYQAILQFFSHEFGHAQILTCFQQLCELDAKVLHVSHYVILLKWLLNGLFSASQQDDAPAIVQDFVSDSTDDLGIKVVKHLQKMQVPLDSVGLGLIINVFAENYDYRAFLTLNYVEDEIGVQPNLKTFLKLIKLCNVMIKREMATEQDKNALIERALHLCNSIIEQPDGITNLPDGSMTSLLYIYAEANVPIPQAVLDVLLQDKIPQAMKSTRQQNDATEANYIIWINTIISAYCKTPNLQTMTIVLRELRNLSITLDDVAIDMIMKSFSKQDATEIFQYLQQGKTDPLMALRLQLQSTNDAVTIMSIYKQMQQGMKKLAPRDYERLVTKLAKCKSIDAFAVFLAFKSQYPKTANFRMYQSLFVNFQFARSRPFVDALWNVYSQHYVNDCDGKDAFVFNVMASMLGRNDSRLAQMERDMKRLGLDRSSNNNQQDEDDNIITTQVMEKDSDHQVRVNKSKATSSLLK